MNQDDINEQVGENRAGMLGGVSPEDHGPNPGVTSLQPGLGQQLRIRADDLIADLLWPRLFRAVDMALRPGRLILGILGILVIGLLDSIGATLSGGGGRSLGEIVAGAAAVTWLDVEHAIGLMARFELQGAALLPPAIWGMISGPIESVWSEAPVRGAVLGPVLLVVILFFWASIARLSALDLARGERVSPAHAFGYALSRWRPLSVAVFGPIIMIGLLWAILASAGWVLLSFPVVNILGALLWPVMLMIGGVMVMIGAGISLGGPMLVPAVVCELEDGIDAFQRAFGYVFRSPARTFVYLLLAIGLGVVSVSIALGVSMMWTGITSAAAETWLSEQASERLGQGAPGSILGVLGAIPLLIVAGFGLSYAATATSVLYLIMRRIVDGQEITELHLPGETAARIDATMATWAALRQSESETG